MGQTITVAQDREFSTDSTVVPREVARGVYIERAPTAQGLKLLLLLIGTAGGRMGDDVQHELRLADLKAISGIKNHSRETMRALFVELRGAVMVYEDAVTKDEIIGGFVDEMRVTGQHGDSGDLYVRWWFGRTFRRIAAESNHWAIIDRQTAFALRSKFAILLFQHVSSLVNLNHVTSKVFSIDELRAVLGVDVNKLARWSDLRRFALDPAISEISQLSRFALTYTLQKTGRNVVRVVVAWEVKDDLRDTRRELDHSKVGRKARREGRGETIVPGAGDMPPFPPRGGFTYSPEWAALFKSTWSELGRPHGNLPDSANVADHVRRVAKDQGLSPNDRGLPKLLRNILKNWKCS